MLFTLALLGPMILASPRSAFPITWVVQTLKRIGPTTPPGRQTVVTLEAGRGEYAAFQVAVQAPSGGLRDVRFAVSPLEGSGGGAIGLRDVARYREEFITIQRHSPVYHPESKHPNLPLHETTFPDALIPFIDPDTGKPPKPARYRAEPIDLPAGTNAAYWIDVFVPEGAPPGNYAGTYVLSSAEGRATGPIQLTVVDFTVPRSPTLRSNFSSDTRDPPGEAQELLRNKLVPDEVSLGAEKRLIDRFGLHTEDLGFSSGAFYGHCVMAPPPSIDAIEDAAARHDPGIVLYDFSADEIERCPQLFPRVKAWARHLHAAGIPNLITIPPVPPLYSDGSGTGRSAVDIWTVLPEEYVRAQAKNPPRITYVQQKGDAVWSYTALVQDGYSPKWEIDFLPIDYRIMTGFIDVSLQLQGILYWSVDYWSKHPWTDIERIASYPGEGVLVYPGADAGLAGVAPSLRLKYVRDGVQDYERVAILERCGHAADALKIARAVGRSWKDWTRDGDALARAYDELGRRIVQWSCAK
jgi:hypothetical protein